MHSAYYDEEAVRREVDAGRHRDAIGGLWDEVGALQLEYLRDQGLQPRHRLLDIGCGSLRLGCRAVDFLEPGCYAGLDLSDVLLQAGYDRELTDAQRARLPRSNLVANDAFDLSALPGTFDVAIAQSVFTHLPFNHIRRCLAAVSERLVPGAVLHASAWLVPDDHPLQRPFEQPGVIDGTRVVTGDIADPYHYRIDDFRHAVRGLPLELASWGSWGHPRGVPMLRFVRT